MFSEVTRLLTLITMMAQGMGIEASHNPEFAELRQDIAPERVLDVMEVQQQRLATEEKHSTQGELE